MNWKLPPNFRTFFEHKNFIEIGEFLDKFLTFKLSAFRELEEVQFLGAYNSDPLEVARKRPLEMEMNEEVVTPHKFGGVTQFAGLSVEKSSRKVAKLTGIVQPMRSLQLGDLANKSNIAGPSNRPSF